MTISVDARPARVYKQFMDFRWLMRDLFVVLLATLLLRPARAIAQAPAEEIPVADVATSAPPEKAKSPPAALVSLLLAGGTGALILSGGGAKENAEPNAENGLAAPALAGPEDEARLADASHVATLTWKPLSGATAYLVDLDTCDATADTCGDFRLERTADVSFTVQIPAPFAARWRVRAIGPDNVAGPFSAFRRFSFSAEE